MERTTHFIQHVGNLEQLAEDIKPSKIKNINTKCSFPDNRDRVIFTSVFPTVLSTVLCKLYVPSRCVLIENKQTNKKPAIIFGETAYWGLAFPR